MKKLLWLASIIIVLINCSAPENQMELSGKVKGLKKGTLLLQKIEDSMLITLDSLLINGNDTFNFSEVIESPEIYYLQVKINNGILQDDRIAFFAEAKPMTINTTLKNFAVKAKITGSENQNKLNEYYKILDRYNFQNLELIEKSFTAKQKGFDSIASSYEASQKSLLSKKYLATINFALNNSDYEIAPYLMISQVKDSKVKYLDTVYQSLHQNIKDSKYGKALESLIQSRVPQE
jgi:hypothetical protein